MGYYWLKILTAVKQYVKSCYAYVTNKYARAKY